MFRFLTLNRVLQLLLFNDHAKYKPTSFEKCKHIFLGSSRDLQN